MVRGAEEVYEDADGIGNVHRFVAVHIPGIRTEERTETALATHDPGVMSKTVSHDGRLGRRISQAIYEAQAAAPGGVLGHRKHEFDAVPRVSGEEIER
jgi:hypothetical protein